MKSVAEQHCDVAEALLRQKPPRLNEALEHFEMALGQESNNARAKAGIERLMSGELKDFKESPSSPEAAD